MREEQFATILMCALIGALVALLYYIYRTHG